MAKITDTSFDDFDVASYKFDDTFSIRRETIESTHVMSSDLEDISSSETHCFPPSAGPTIVTVKTRVVVTSARQLRSKAYLATIRRRDAAKLSQMVEELIDKLDRDDFAACVYPLSAQIMATVSKLQEAEMEGNSREILRQLRDSLLDGGWEQLRRVDFRDGIISILDGLRRLESVEPEHASNARETLDQLGIEQVGIPFFDVEETEIPD